MLVSVSEGEKFRDKCGKATLNPFFVDTAMLHKRVQSTIFYNVIFLNDTQS